MEPQPPILRYARREQPGHFSYRRLVLPFIAGLLTAAVNPFVYPDVFGVIAFWLVIGTALGLGAAIGRSTPRKLHIVEYCAAYVAMAGICTIAVGQIVECVHPVPGDEVWVAAVLGALIGTPGVFVVSLFGAYLGAPRRRAAKPESSEADSSGP